MGGSNKPQPKVKPINATLCSFAIDLPSLRGEGVMEFSKGLFGQPSDIRGRCECRGFLNKPPLGRPELCRLSHPHRSRHLPRNSSF